MLARVVNRQGQDEVFDVSSVPTHEHRLRLREPRAVKQLHEGAYVWRIRGNGKIWTASEATTQLFDGAAEVVCFCFDCR
jgi:hypothetical protein